MSMIVHRCRTCRRSDFQHNDGWRCRQPNYGAPELIPTWSSAINGRSELVSWIVPPGEELPAGGMSARPKSCDCSACHDLYTELTGEAP